MDVPTKRKSNAPACMGMWASSNSVKDKYSADLSAHSYFTEIPSMTTACLGADSAAGSSHS